MKRIDSRFSDFARTPGLIGLIGALSLWSVQAALPPSALGAWDRGGKFDPKDYP